MQLRIGQFAKVGMVSVSLLRYYDEVDLFKPALTDRWTGYRYYALAQLAMLNRILALKDLGLSLEQIKQLLGEELPADQIRGMLRLKRAELQEQAREIDERLARVEMRLKQIDMEGKMSSYDVVLKKVDTVRGAVLRDTVPDMDVVNATFDRLFDEVFAYVSSNGGEMVGPCFDLWYDSPDERPQNLRVAVVAPLGKDIAGSERIKMEDVPGSAQVASVLHRGSFATLGQSYGALMEWISANGYTIAGPCREIYLQYERTGNPDEWVTELQFPVEKVS